MKWMLVMIVFGQPVKTDLVYPSLRACLQAEESVRKEYADSYNETTKWVGANRPADYDAAEKLARERSHRGTCIPHAAP